mmetsp:Transcript_30980/g.100942  ORF Transcript_30980/g.100942 Transcript_30980/m.100942 type:complete len:452 (-) Transcript_30980:328-1683(-)
MRRDTEALLVFFPRLLRIITTPSPPPAVPAPDRRDLRRVPDGRKLPRRASSSSCSASSSAKHHRVFVAVAKAAVAVHLARLRHLPGKPRSRPELHHAYARQKLFGHPRHPRVGARPEIVERLDPALLLHRFLVLLRNGNVGERVDRLILAKLVARARHGYDWSERALVDEVLPVAFVQRELGHRFGGVALRLNLFAAEHLDDNLKRANLGRELSEVVVGREVANPERRDALVLNHVAARGGDVAHLDKELEGSKLDELDAEVFVGGHVSDAQRPGHFARRDVVVGAAKDFVEAVRRREQLVRDGVHLAQARDGEHRLLLDVDVVNAQRVEEHLDELVHLRQARLLLHQLLVVRELGDDGAPLLLQKVILPFDVGNPEVPKTFRSHALLRLWLGAHVGDAHRQLPSHAAVLRLAQAGERPDNLLTNQPLLPVLRHRQRPNRNQGQLLHTRIL